MADLTVTAGNVVAATGASTLNGTAGATVTAGQTVYLDSTTSTLKLCDANLSLAASTTKGIALHGASSGQPLQIQTGGDINPGDTVVVGKIYVQSATAGGIAVAADLATGHYVTVIGVGTTASNIHLVMYNSLVAVP